ncbi:MAG: S-layer homology domain-containing protein [Clostridia bacterium]|nr:S-layer homology domain-containing protein [Clostridia bacterium]
MRTLRSLVAVILAMLMVLTMSVSAFAAYEDLSYEDVSENFNTTLSSAALLQIKFADSLGIVSGMKNGSFYPEAKITRGEALRIAYRMLHYNYDEIEDYASVNTDFDEMGESGDISDVAMIKPYVAWAMDYQLINSEYVPNAQFEADKNITGEEFITLIKKVCGMVEEAYAEYFEAAEGGEPEGYYDYYTFEDLCENFEENVFALAEISAESESINREQAAVAVANAMIYDPQAGMISDDMFTYFELEADVRLNCLATRIYGCDYINLFIRAAKERPLEYENVTGDMLLSNGVQVSTGMDMSKFVGFPILVLYMDKDNSATYTEDEEMFGYEIQSPMVYTKSLSELTVTNNISVSGLDGNDVFAMYANTPHYLNDAPWPNNDTYNLFKMLGKPVPGSGEVVATRPNLEFTFIKSASTNNADLVLALEWIPGRVMTVNAGYISVFSYYDNKTYVYEDRNVVYAGTSTLQSGDFINFYDSNGTLHVTNGTTVELEAYEEGVDSITGLKQLTAGEDVYLRHAFFDNTSAVNFDGSVTAILDYTGTSYIALTEAQKTKDVAVEILSADANADGKTALIKAKVLATGESIELKDVEIERINSRTGKMEAGDLFTYYLTANDKVHMDGIDPMDMVVIEMEDYFIAEGGVKYLKAEHYQAGENPINGMATLMIDRFGGVWAVK